MYWIKVIEDGAARQMEQRKTTDEVHECSEGRHAEGWCDRRQIIGRQVICCGDP